MYGKFISGKFVSAPNPLVSGNRKIYNPRSEDYIADGYTEVIEAEYPENIDGKYYEKKYELRDGVIYAVWEEAERSTPPANLGDRVSAIEAQVTDTQLALCELYEALCSSDTMEV